MTTVVQDVAVIIDTDDHLEALLPAWSALSDELGESFYARPWYSLAWWSELGKGELAVYCVHRGSRLVALAPLHRRRLLGQPVLRLLGHGLGTVGEILVVDNSAATALWQAIADDGAALQLTHVRPDAAAILALRHHPRWQQRVEINDRCPVARLSRYSTARDLRGQRTLRQFARYRAALDRASTPFDVEVEVVDDLDGLERRWPDMVRVAALADADGRRQHLFAAPWVSFTRRFLEQEANNGTLLVLGGTAGGQWVAHDIDFCTGQTLTQWVSRFDPALAARSPGHLILEWLVNHHDDLYVDTIDALLGENSLKSLWANSGYDVATVTAATTELTVARARLGLAGLLGSAVRAVSR